MRKYIENVNRSTQRIEFFFKMTPRKNKTAIFEEVIYYCAIPIDSDKLFDKVTRYIQVNRYNFRIMNELQDFNF